MNIMHHMKAKRMSVSISPAIMQELKNKKIELSGDLIRLALAEHLGLDPAAAELSHGGKRKNAGAKWMKEQSKDEKQ